MTTHITITSGQKDAESPIDVNLIGQMIDNPSAGLEGDSSAPTRGAGVILDNGSLSSSSSLDIDMTTFTAWRNKILVLDSFIPSSDGQNLNFKVSTNGGSTFDGDTGNYTYSKKQHSSTPSSSDTGGTNSTLVLGTAIGTGTGEACHTIITMFDTTNVAAYPMFRIDSVFYNSSPTMNIYSYAGVRTAAQDTDAVRVAFASGNIASGNWALLGYN